MYHFKVQISLYIFLLSFIFTIIFGPLLFIELRAIFLYEFKLGHKATEVSRNINNGHSIRKPQTNVRCNVDFTNFGMEMRALKMKKIMDVHRQLTMTN